MKSLNHTVCCAALPAAAASLLALLTSSAAHAQIAVTTYQTAFNATTAAPGWAYQYNPNSPITNTASFVNLVGSGGGAAGGYTVDGDLALPRANPGAFVSLFQNEAHPGLGSLQTGTFDVYAIARYTVSIADTYSITNSSATRLNGSFSGSDEVRIFVNNNAPVLSTAFTGPINFNVNLGALNVGDNIYVAFGPSGDHRFDTVEPMDYTITRAGVSVAAPEPATLVLLAGSLLPVMLTATRRCYRGSRTAASQRNKAA